tara:strand:+ start:345 stop:863 length:519 start_codon:yes stop_codon:yes gene_type:complete
MGLKEDLIKAKVEGLKAALKNSGTNIEDKDIDKSDGSGIEVEAELLKEAILTFLSKCNFTITQLNAPVVLEQFKIPAQDGDIQSSVKVAPGISTQGYAPGKTMSTGDLSGGKKGVKTKINIEKQRGGLKSTGYTYIGTDPDSQKEFNVSDTNNQTRYTNVEFIRDAQDKGLE